MNRLITSKEIQEINKKCPTKKNFGTDGFTGTFYQIFTELGPTFQKFSPKIEEEERPPNSFYETSSTLIPNQTYYKKTTDQSL